MCLDLVHSEGSFPKNDIEKFLPLFTCTSPLLSSVLGASSAETTWSGFFSLPPECTKTSQYVLTSLNKFNIQEATVYQPQLRV